MRKIATADVGGTHARFALAAIDGGRVTDLGEPVTVKTEEFRASSMPGRNSGEGSMSRCPRNWRSRSPGPSAETS